jgi:hypothetical protein
MSTKENDKESEEPDYDEDNDQLEEEQEEETGELNNQGSTTNKVFWIPIRVQYGGFPDGDDDKTS